ncbi:AfsR/SARP family transcriptional regulator [Streptomyces sp. LP05-1]|uniref:AfsR/SARP family transcriptional regulator n=1 Tax=Streptomyces pyxinae TaxID=2970734 RepID=A0ABT2CLU4_9ACTN|nr:AfsR/SARP family transcriptional regulator [Streptomyces sp. LP05-1]MCS0638057.1 AfsR/SARP family transcriptional regulator [Streptomyces sp. LP05-1]
MRVAMYQVDRIPEETPPAEAPVPAGMRCELLGPLRIGTGDGDDTVGVAPKIRTVLAMLCVHPDQVVPVPALMRELWSERPPASGLRTLQTYVLNARKLLSQVTGDSPVDVARDVLVTRAGGYCLRSAGIRLDWLEFRRLTERGTAAVRAGDSLGGIRLLEEALGLWRGDVLADVPTGPVLESRRLLLEESRLDAVEALVEAKIAAGLHKEVIADLASLTSEHAFHEGLHAQYMRALALNGRRARALEVFGGLRARLVEEIGIEPGYPLQRLQLTILNSHTAEYAPISVE